MHGHAVFYGILLGHGVEQIGFPGPKYFIGTGGIVSVPKAMAGNGLECSNFKYFGNPT